MVTYNKLLFEQSILDIYPTKQCTVPSVYLEVRGEKTEIMREEGKRINVEVA